MINYWVDYLQWNYQTLNVNNILRKKDRKEEIQINKTETQREREK